MTVSSIFEKAVPVYYIRKDGMYMSGYNAYEATEPLETNMYFYNKTTAGVIANANGAEIEEVSRHG